MILDRSFAAQDGSGEAALADALTRVRVQGVVQHHAHFRGRWGIDVRPDAGYAGLYVSTRGRVWVGASPDALVHAPQGAVVLARPGRRHVVSSHRDALTRDARSFLADCDTQGPLRITHGRGRPVVELVVGFLRFPADDGNALLDTLPPVLVVEGDASLRRVLDALCDELATPRAGYRGVVDRLAEVILIGAVRAWASGDPAGARPGLLRARLDAHVARSLDRMHEDPAADWTVASLARAVGLSRTAFAVRFSALVGAGPMAYLRRLRAHRATELLRETDASMAQIAERVGYGSEAAFGRAFAAEIGVPPATWRRSAMATR